MTGPSTASSKNSQLPLSCRLCGYRDDPTSPPPSSGLVHISALYASLQETSCRKEADLKKRFVELTEKMDNIEAQNCDLRNTVGFLKGQSGKKGLAEIDEWKQLVSSLQEDRARLRRELDVMRGRAGDGGGVDWEVDNGSEVRSLRQKVEELEEELRESQRNNTPTVRFTEAEPRAPPGSMTVLREERPPYPHTLQMVHGNEREGYLKGVRGLGLSIVKSVRGVIVGVILGFRIVTTAHVTEKKFDVDSDSDVCAEVKNVAAIIV